MQTFWHLTDDADFSPSASARPAIGGRASECGGLFLTDDPDWWLTHHPEWRRPYLAEVHVPHGVALIVTEREVFIPERDLARVHVVRVTART